MAWQLSILERQAREAAAIAAAKREAAALDAELAVRYNAQRIMNNGGVGMWGLIHTVPVNRAGVPTGR